MTEKKLYIEDKSTFYGKIILFLTLLSFLCMLIFGFVSFSTMAIAKNKSEQGKATDISSSTSIHLDLNGVLPDIDG